MMEEIIEIISNYQNIDRNLINENSNLISDIGLSSFDVIALVCEFENRFKIEIPDRAIKNLKTIKDVITYIEENK